MNSTQLCTSHQPAPFWRRLAAMVYDGFLLLAVLIFAGFINLAAHLLIHGQQHLYEMMQAGYSLSSPWFNVGLFTVMYGFFAFFWSRHGQTLGMRAWKIKVVTLEHQLLTPSACLVRFLVAFPAILLGGLGLIWALFHPHGRGWHDLASSSQLVMV